VAIVVNLGACSRVGPGRNHRIARRDCDCFGINIAVVFVVDYHCDFYDEEVMFS
jgi:hypothetical protein